MADQAAPPTDLADDADQATTNTPADEHADGAPAAVVEHVTARAVVVGDPDGDLMGELARAMHAAAVSQYERLNGELERRRSAHVDAITTRANADVEGLKSHAEADVAAIDSWSKIEAEKIKQERLRRIDARGEQLMAQLERQATIKEREIAAIEGAIDAHRKAVDEFFGRMERETDPAAIARLASTMPAFPALDEVAAQAGRTAEAEFAGLDAEAAASAEAEAAAEAHAEAEMQAQGDVEAEPVAGEPRLRGVMDPGAARAEGQPEHPWEAPHAVSVAAGTGEAAEGHAEDQEPHNRVGSSLLRTVRAIRPMSGGGEKGSDDR